jgi:hypothetical protein
MNMDTVMLTIVKHPSLVIENKQKQILRFWSPMDSTGVLKSDLSRPGARSSGAQCACGIGMTSSSAFSSTY